MKKIVGIVAVLMACTWSGAAVAADGASIYGSKCAMCHGAEGKGVAMMGPALAGNDIVKGEEGAIKELIRTGRAGSDIKYPNFPMGMTSFSMSDEELDAVVTYLKGL